MRKARLIALTGTLVFALIRPAAAQYSFSEYGGHWYALTQGASSWSMAQQEANALGGSLASIQSAGENLFVRSLGDTMAGGMSIWIGLLQPFTTWADGSAVTYTNWNAWEPNNCCGSVLATQVYGSTGYGPYGTWDDTDASSAFFGVMEFTTNPNTTVTPEPVSMALLGTGLAGVGALRRRRRKQAEAD